MNEELKVSTNSEARDGLELRRNADCTGEDANTFASSGEIIVTVPDCGALVSSEAERKFDLFEFELGEWKGGRERAGVVPFK